MLRGLLSDRALQVGMFVVGPAILILLLRLGTVQLRKLGAFLMILDEKPGWRDSPDWKAKRFMPPPKDDRPTLPGRHDLPRHSAKTMFYSLLKFLTCIFTLTFLSYGVIFVPMIILWVVFAVFARKYIILWRAHKYSAAFLICASIITLALSFFVSPFIRTFFAFLARTLF